MFVLSSEPRVLRRFFQGVPACAVGLLALAAVAHSGELLIDEQFPNTNRFDGTLPESARWVQNATTVEGGAATASIVPNELLGGNALRVANVGWVQWTSAAFPQKELVDVGDQLVLSFDLVFAQDGLRERDQGFVVGFLDQKATPIAALDVTGDFGNFGTGRSNAWAAYFFRLATGQAGASNFGRRGPADTFQGWWTTSAQSLGSMRGMFFSQTERVYSVRFGLVRTAPGELTGFLDIPGVLPERAIFTDAAALTSRFDAIAFRADYNPDLGEAPPVFYVGNLRLEFIPEGPAPDEGVGPVDPPPTADRGEPPPAPPTVSWTETFFGLTMTHLQPWFWAEETGFAYSPTGAIDGAGWYFILHNGLGWIYTSEGLHPWVYSDRLEQWVFVEGSLGEDPMLYATTYGLWTPFPVALRHVFVATWGNDENSGTASAPYRTIQKALNEAQPGDRIWVREGVYAERMAPVRAGSAVYPIHVSAYIDEAGIPEEVTVTAMALVTPGQNGFGEWSQHDGNIYRISLPAGQVLNGSRTLVFANGEALTPARFPDTVNFWQVRREDMLSAEEMLTRPGNRRAYRNPALDGFPDDAWRGAFLHFFPGHAWYEVYRPVENSSGDLIEFIPASNPLFNPVEGDIFYLYDTLTALTQPGEFFFDFRGINGPVNTLYVWMPDGSHPGDADIEYRAREYTILNTAFPHYTFRHLRLVAGWNRFLAAATDIHLDHIEILYGGFNNEPWAQEAAVDFRGARSAFTNGSILFSRGFNIRTLASDNRVENSILGWGNWGNVDGHGLDGTINLRFRQNTVFSAAGVNVNINGFASDYSWNHVYDGGFAATDIANMNAHGGENAQGTVVSHNWVHGAFGLHDPTRTGHAGGFGIRVDAGEATGNYRIYRNVVWDVTRHDISVWGVLTPAAELWGDVRNFVFHNTVEDEIAVAPANRGNPSGTVIRNNIMLGSFAPIYNLANPDTVFEFNVVATGDWGEANFIGDPGIADFARQDFSLLPDSPAIDFGAFIPGVTRTWTGAFPDAGAYEAGVRPWFPGARVRAVDLPGLSLEPMGGGRSRIAGIPFGRKPTDDFTVRIGEDGPHLPVRHHYDSTTHMAEVEVDAVPDNSPVYFSLDGRTFVRANP